MYIYFGVLIIYSVVQFFLKKRKLPYDKELAVVAMFVLSLLTAFRGSAVGNDTENYLRIFRMNIEGVYLDAWNERFEMGYMLLNKIFAVFGFEQLILIVTSLITYLCFTYFIVEWSQNVWLSVYMFFMLRYFAEAMNTVRLCMACALLMVAYDRFLKKHILQFIFIVLVATSFHRTAIIFLIVLVFKYIRLERKLVMLWGLVTSVGFLVLPLITKLLVYIFPSFSYYLGSAYDEKGISMAGAMYTIVWLMVFIVCFYIQKVYNCKNDELNIMNVTMIIAVSVFVLTMRFNLFDRIAQYFAIYAIVYLPNCIEQITNDKKRKIIKGCVISFCFCYFWVIQLLRPEWNVITPYIPFWRN